MPVVESCQVITGSEIAALMTRLWSAEMSPEPKVLSQDDVWQIFGLLAEVIYLRRVLAAVDFGAIVLERPCVAPPAVSQAASSACCGENRNE